MSFQAIHRPTPAALASVLALSLGILLAACSPTLNWRQVHPEGVDMTVLLPCKPDRASKSVPLGGRETLLSMTGCEAGGAMYALAVAELSDAGSVGEVLAQWQALTLTHMRADASTQQRKPMPVPGADGPSPLLLSARGSHPDGQAIEGQALFFARGARVFQAVIYAPRINAEAAETFFRGMKLP